MTSDEGKNAEELFYDFRETYIPYKILSGTTLIKFKKPMRYLYLYRIAVYLFLISMIIFFMMSAIISIQDLAEFGEAFHISVVLSTMACYLPNARLFKGCIQETYQKMKECFYKYNGDLNEEQKEIKRAVIRDVKKSHKKFRFVLYLAAILYMCITPVKAYMFPHLTLKGTTPFISKKLPIPVYIPYQDPYGFAFYSLFIVECYSCFLVASLVSSVHESYVSLSGEIYGEMKLLNYSICHIEDRAMKAYGKMASEKLVGHRIVFRTPFYQKCLNDCLREDCDHHKELLSCLKLVRRYLGNVVMTYISFGSIVCAVSVYITYKMLQEGAGSMDKVALFVGVVVSEGIFLFDLCLFNEKISSESDELFFQLYSLPWYKADKTFCQNLLFMLLFTKVNPPVNENFFNIKASFETFLALVNAVFSYLNVLANLT